MLLHLPITRSIFNSLKQSIWSLFSIPKRSRKLRRIKKHILTGLIVGCLCISLSFGFSQLIGTFKGNTSVAATTMVPPFYTRSSHIVDSTDKVVSLRGINWFGMEVKTHAPHGLWVRDYKQMLRHIKSLGYNLIRLPYSVEALQSSQISRANARKMT
ncbi:MAG: hypothetical protein IGS23_03890 [Rivularia sp. T60_A2020_040]|nr:hypothetical protein [Rivularia sp. T60_A2020_040]